MDNYTDIEHRSIAYFNVLFAFYFVSTSPCPISLSPPLLPAQNQLDILTCHCGFFGVRLWVSVKSRETLDIFVK